MMVGNTPEDSSDRRQASSQPAWAELVDKIKENDTTGLEELYRVFSRGVRFYLCRQLGPQDLDDRVHDTFLTVAQAIQRGDSMYLPKLGSAMAKVARAVSIPLAPVRCSTPLSARLATLEGRLQYRTASSGGR